MDLSPTQFVILIISSALLFGGSRLSSMMIKLFTGVNDLERSPKVFVNGDAPAEAPAREQLMRQDATPTQAS